MNAETRQCQNCKNSFTIEPDDFDFYNKIKVPPPTFCPDCRLIRRLMWRNERTWYKRVCDATQKPILSMYSPDSPYKVYENNFWKSDGWDPMDYGQDYDPNKSFFDQYKKLLISIPQQNLIQKNNVNSDYSNASLNLKNCYFCASSDTGEDSAYVFNAMLRFKNCFDAHQSSDVEYCYEIVDTKKSSRSLFLQNCEACVDSMFLYDCKNCTDCFGCVGLRNKQYYIFNQQFSRNEYNKKIEELRDGKNTTLSKAREVFERLKIEIPRRYAIIINSHNASGDDINDSRNIFLSFSVRNNVENCRYGFRVWENTKDVMDAFVAWKGSEMLYETVSVTAQRTFFSAYIWGGFDIFYSYNCFDCNNIFGCVGLRNKSYCIFNKQYQKEEYLNLVEKIISRMKNDKEFGEFFPVYVAPFAYNETINNDYFPKTENEIIKHEYRYKEIEKREYIPTISTESLPDSITDVTDTILREVIECEHKGNCNEKCATAFKIIPEELQFYRNMKIPLPKLCPSCRHYARVKQKNPMKLWARSCMCSQPGHFHEEDKCVEEFKTSYDPDRPEIIYCEKCYQAEII